MSLSILKSFSLDFTRSAPLEYIFAKQGDQNSRILEITPLNSGAAYTIPAGTSVRFGAKKPDGTQVLNDASISNGKIYVTLSQQTLAAAGILVGEVGLYGLSDELLSSQHFYLKVEPFAIDPDQAESSDEYESFVAALLALDAAIRASENVNISAVQTATGADITVTNRDGESTTVHIDTMYAISTWADVQNTVRLGLGETLFPVGYEFETPKETSLSAGVGHDNTGVTAVTVDEATFLHAIGEAHNGYYEATFDGDVWQKENGDGVVLADYGITITTGTPAAGDKIIITETASSIKWVVRGHDHHVAANGHLEHTMTLETKFVYGTSAAYKSLVFDAPEAFYYAENGLAAGSYYFTVKNQAWYAADNDVPYYFTLANDVPAGGQLVINMTYNQSLQNKTVSVYASKTATSASETVSLSSTAIAGATNLGEPDGQTANMNFMHRIVFGSNNYAQSNIRQWLNATGKVNTYYTPQTKFDRPNGNLIGSDAAYAGFAHGLGDDFLNAVAVAVIPCRTNDVYEVDSLDGTTFAKSATYNLRDRFFLLSRPEIYGSWDSSSLKDGELLDYYDGLTNAERIKYDSFGAARYAWLRSPYPSYGSIERIVHTDGSLHNYGANSAGGAAVACIIA